MDTPVPPGRTPTVPSPAPPAAVADGRYVLEELLGSGGMGLVYRARDEELGRAVAVKLLADNLAADEEARERFAREARAAARLTHPNVVQVFDVGEESGRPYFVMELVDGPSLADVLRTSGPLPALEVEDVAVQALRGLGRAHAAGLLHRDLKPGNLLRSEAGVTARRAGRAVVKVTDFGVAQAAELPGMTRTGLVLGTLSYLAPERLAGAPASVASDLYGLGATLLELLTGTAPDAARPDDVHGWALKELDTVPPRLAGMLVTCLARDPEERPASTEAALAILQGDAPVPAVPTPSPASAPATRALPVEEHAQTVVAAAGARAAVDGDADTPAPTSDASDGTGEGLPQPLRARGWVRWLVLAGLAVLVVLVVAQLTGAGGGAVDTGVPEGGSPAETARNMAEWLRDQAR